MRLAFQILRKDVERLRWAILITLALLCIWTYQECTAGASLRRMITTPTAGSWLNIALPFAWSVLIALAVQQDPLAGDRQFWVALPCGWRSLLTAKAAFIGLFIHFPYLVATVCVLLARGFNPVAHMPHLFWKQTVLLALVLPALAASTLVRNLAHFLLLLIAVASAVLLTANMFNSGVQVDMPWDIHWALALIGLTSGALIVVVLQFVQRSTRSSRALGVITAVAALSVYNWLPGDATAAIFAKVHPVPESLSGASIHLGSIGPGDVVAQRYYYYKRTTTLIPIILTGGPDSGEQNPDALVPRLNQISLEIISASGERFAQTEMNRLTAQLTQLNASSPLWQVLMFDNSAVWNRIRSGPVTIRGRALVAYYKTGKSYTVRAGERSEWNGTGRCATDSFAAPTSSAFAIFSIECESPEIAARDMNLGRSQNDQVIPMGPLGEYRFVGYWHYPQDPWLSPIHRGTRSTMGYDEPHTLVVTPQTLAGTALIDYTLPNVDLNQFVVVEPVREESAK